jgi:hypothetical protein
LLQRFAAWGDSDFNNCWLRGAVPAGRDADLTQLQRFAAWGEADFNNSWLRGAVLAWSGAVALFGHGAVLIAQLRQRLAMDFVVL